MAGSSQVERHRIYIQNLERKKRLEKESEAARNASRRTEEERERGFANYLNGANANRDGAGAKSLPRPPQHREPPRQNSNERLLRVAGALPVPSPFEHREAWGEPSHPPLRTAVGQHERAVARKPRKTWEVGKAVLVRGADGAVLQIDAPQWAAAALAVA